jgi:hypothetical protein
MRALIPTISIVVALCGLAIAQEKPTTQPTSKPAAKKASGLPALGDPAGVYGAGVKAPKGMRLNTAAKKVGKLHGRPIRVDGYIDDVCLKKGCWMVMRDGETEVRVKFKDYGFFVPRDSKGREVIIEGILTETTISEEMAKHYAEEGGEPEKAKLIKGPQKTLAFTATGAEILGRRALPPEAEPAGPKALAALKAKLDAAKKVMGTPATAKSLVQGLSLLRYVPGARALEYSLCTDVAGWLVFSKEGKAFDAGYAIKKGTGDVFVY